MLVVVYQAEILAASYIFRTNLILYCLYCLLDTIFILSFGFSGFMVTHQLFYILFFKKFLFTLLLFPILQEVFIIFFFWSFSLFWPQRLKFYHPQTSSPNRLSWYFSCDLSFSHISCILIFLKHFSATNSM